MRSIKMLGLALVAVLAFSAIAASAASAYTEFKASEAGTLGGKATNTQKFKTGTGATVECTAASPSGTVKAGELSVTSIEISVSYSGCTVFKLPGTATVSLADYTFFVTPLVSVLKTITIEAGALGVECTVVVASGQSLGSASKELEFNNKGKKVELVSKVTKITSKITKSNSKSLCGEVNEESKVGTYEGTDEVELNGGTGTIEVK